MMVSCYCLTVWFLWWQPTVQSHKQLRWRRWWSWVFNNDCVRFIEFDEERSRIYWFSNNYCDRSFSEPQKGSDVTRHDKPGVKPISPVDELAVDAFEDNFVIRCRRNVSLVFGYNSTQVLQKVNTYQANLINSTLYAVDTIRFSCNIYGKQQLQIKSNKCHDNPAAVTSLICGDDGTSARTGNQSCQLTLDVQPEQLQNGRCTAAVCSDVVQTVALLLS